MDFDSKSMKFRGWIWTLNTDEFCCLGSQNTEVAKWKICRSKISYS